MSRNWRNGTRPSPPHAVLRGRSSPVQPGRFARGNALRRRRLHASAPLIHRRRRTLSGLVGVIGEDDSFGKVAHGLKMLFAQGRAASRDCARHTSPKERDDVGVALAHDYLAGLDDVILRPVQRVKSPALGVDGRLGLFLYFGSTRPSGRTVSLAEGRILPPTATALPEGSKIGKMTRARSASCRRSRLFTKPSPVPSSTLGDKLSELLRASQSSGAHPSWNFRATSPFIPRVFRYSRAGLASVRSADVRDTSARLVHRGEELLTLLTRGTSVQVLVQLDARSIRE